MTRKPKNPPIVEERRIDAMPLDDIQEATRNPKTHDAAALDASLTRFGFTEPLIIDERTGRLVAGHGRLTALREKRARGETPPAGVTIVNEKWCVPVARGWRSKNDSDADAYLIASNRIPETGGWDEAALVELARELDSAAGGLSGTGIESEALVELNEAQRAIQVAEIESGPLTTTFWLTVRGPLSQQPDVLQKLRGVLADLTGVKIDTGVFEQ